MSSASNAARADEISAAAFALKNGDLVAFPTETVYGLGADATNRRAVSRVYEVKGRPHDHPLIVHVSQLELAQRWSDEFSQYALELATAFWPGPMTLILKRSDLAQDFVTGNQDTVGVRIPSHEIALDLLSAFESMGGLGVAAPSANRFGAVSPTDAASVIEELGSELSARDLVLDGGASAVGVESTIIDCTGPAPRILRLGAITQEMIEQVTGMQVDGSIREREIRVSGSLESHYSPRAHVILDSEDFVAGAGFIAFAEIPTPKNLVRLASPSTIDEYAHMLYSALREADHRGISKIFVIQPQGDGLSAAIRDRLWRAASHA